MSRIMENVATTEKSSAGLEGARPSVKERPIGGTPFDWASVILSTWLVGGAYLDGWAHHHIPELESFFTPWHGVLYSGFLAGAAFLFLALIVSHARGYPWRGSLPAGYELSLLGAAIFAAGGIGDMVWHQVFGIEVDVEALTSPTHLALALGGALIASGPLRAAWRRPDAGAREGWVRRLPMALSMALTLAILMFITQYSSPFVFTWAATSRRTGDVFFGQSLGVMSIILHTGLFMGLVLVAVRRWGRTLPIGSLALVLTLNAALLSFFQDTYLLIPAMAVAGVVSDLLLRLLKPSVERPIALRLFALLVPVVVYTFYFIDLMLTSGIWWSVHIWAGSIALAGFAGWLLSYVFIPPQVPC
jgi:hypothetical protein